MKLFKVLPYNTNFEQAVKKLELCLCLPVFYYFSHLCPC
jgi:hypothetical protein